MLILPCLWFFLELCVKPHAQEFWDTSQEHKNDILIFIDGRKEPSI